jgi:hypothetical protein
MKKLIGIVLVLALPAMAFGATSNTISLLSGGVDHLDLASDYSAQNVSLDIVVDFSTITNFSVSGGLGGPAALSSVGVSNRVYGQFMTDAANLGYAWTKQVVSNTTFNAGTVGTSVDFGAEQRNGAPGDLAPDSPYLPAGQTTFVTVTLAIPAGIPIGSYLIDVVDGTPNGAFNGHGYWASYDETTTQGPEDWTGRNGFTINITPEPATMLLLAGALPFLRRRLA